jgi:hypothetical protein
VAYQDPYRRRQVDRTGLIAVVIAFVALVGMLLAVPGLLPTPVRNLVGLGPQRVALPPTPSGTGPYKLLATQDGSKKPVGYDPCKRIEIRVNLDGAPPGSLELVKQAMGVVERATGLRFDYLGTTDQRPQWEDETVPVIAGRPHTSPVLVSWATSREVKALAGDVAGLGGSVSVPDSSGVRWFVTGGITLDSDDFEKIDSSDEGRPEELAIILHEFGHLVGLAHVHDDNELMNASNVGVLGYGPGDLEGLAAIGSIDCG